MTMLQRQCLTALHRIVNDAMMLSYITFFLISDHISMRQPISTIRCMYIQGVKQILAYCNFFDPTTIFGARAPTFMGGPGETLSVRFFAYKT